MPRCGRGLHAFMPLALPCPTASSVPRRFAKQPRIFEAGGSREEKGPQKIKAAFPRRDNASPHGRTPCLIHCNGPPHRTRRPRRAHEHGRKKREEQTRPREAVSSPITRIKSGDRRFRSTDGADYFPSSPSLRKKSSRSSDSPCISSPLSRMRSSSTRCKSATGSCSSSIKTNE